MSRPEPRLVTVIKRLADLETLPSLLPSEMHELNQLRIELGEKWPAVGIALALAYVEAGP